jgi:hypothetical protein
MKLSPEEETFLRQWIHDEACFQEGQGPAKLLQLENRVRPADLAVLIAASLPDPGEQQAAARTPPGEPPRWPWSAESLAVRLHQARAHLGLPPAEEATPSAT